MNLARWICLLSLSTVAPLAFGVSSIYTVTSTGSGGACMANSTTDPSCTLDAAINAVGDGDFVRFAAAVQGRTIYGVYLRNDFGSVTIDGSPNGVTLDGAGSGPLLALNSGNVTLSHLNLQNSTANAIYDAGAALTIDSCTFEGNSTSSPSDANGGAVVQVGGSVLIVNSTFAGNVASGNGGAIYANGNLVIGNSTVTANRAANGGGIGGYGFTIMSSIVAGNSATTSSPDIYGSGYPTDSAGRSRSATTSSTILRVRV
jgi:predicted outer membrane repeat protein